MLSYWCIRLRICSPKRMPGDGPVELVPPTDSLQEGLVPPPPEASAGRQKRSHSPLLLLGLWPLLMLPLVCTSACKGSGTPLLLQRGGSRMCNGTRAATATAAAAPAAVSLLVLLLLLPAALV